MNTHILKSLLAALLSAACFTTASMAEDKPAGDPKPSKASGAKVPFLGVAPSSLDEALAAQLNLPGGVGLLVHAVQPGSPAEKAGLKQHDVLHYFNDQLLVNEDQLQTLVRQAGAGTEVTLKVLRKGAPETIAVKLGEQEAREAAVDVLRWRAPQPGARGPHDWQKFSIPLKSEAFADQVRDLSERLKALEGKPEKWQAELERFQKELKEQSKKWVDEAAKNAEEPRKPHGATAQTKGSVKIDKVDGGTYQIQVHGSEDKADAVGSAVVTATSDGSGNVLITQSDTTRMAWSDNDGSGELLIADGKKRLTAKDRDGKELFSGPVDTDDQRARLPGSLRERLERLEKTVKVEVRVDTQAKP